jgi:hypothetical protein
MGHFPVAAEKTPGIFATIPAFRTNVQNFVAALASGARPPSEAR